MSSDRQKNLNLSSSSLKPSILTSAKTSTLLTTLSSTNSASILSQKLSTLGINSGLSKNHNQSESNDDLKAKRMKFTLTTNEKVLKKNLLSMKPIDIGSTLSSKINTNLNKSILTHDLTKNSNILLSKNSHNVISTFSLLNKSNNHLAKMNKLAVINNEKNEIVSKRPHFDMDSSNDDITFIHEEFLKTEALIQKINNELKSNEEEFRKSKRLKTNNSTNINFIDSSCLKLKNELTMIQRQKSQLINAVSSSLLSQPNFKNRNDQTRLSLIKYADLVIKFDPEFILKLALYTRRELKIRVTANFLLCLASFKEECRRFLARYFKESVMLPSDWIEIAEQYQLFMDKKINYGSLPSALRKVMVEKFTDFDEYQLAKYNKEKSRLAKNKLLRGVKHLKSKPKEGEDGERSGAEVLVEDKFIKENKNGLKIKDRIYFELVVNENCNYLKFDLIFREEQASASSTLIPAKTRRGNPIKKPNEKKQINESIALRLLVDYVNRRLTQKSFLNKTWSKRSENINSPKKFNFYRGFDSIKFFIDVESNEFRFGFIDNKDSKEFNLASYAHSKHNIELFKLNLVRISGSGIKLKDLKIYSLDAIQLDSQISEENENDIKQRSYTIKQLVRQLHISTPVEYVMSIIGKKYPMTFEEFMQSKLPGVFDSDKAGKRMKLATPETWETQISMKGNKASVWEQLIDNKKLPYMAMLRNLRNMIKTGISEKHHQFVIRKLQDEGAVINSKQFPFRFFTAYEVLDELEQEYDSWLQWSSTGQFQPTPTPKMRKNKAKTDKKFSDMSYDKEILKRYKTALDNALKVATTYNISPIKGSTAIFLNLGKSMEYYASGSAKSLGKKVTKISDIAGLLALMFKYSCEHSRLFIFTDSVTYSDIELEQGTILDNMKSLTELKNMKVSSSNMSNYPRKAFQDILSLKEHYDNIIYLSNSITDVDYHKSFLRKYRAYVNQNLLFVNVNLSALECSLTHNENFDHDNDINISGYSDSILRFVAERGNQGQLIHVDNIDKSYELPAIKNSLNDQAVLNTKKKIISTMIERPKFKIFVPSLKWKSVKVFISSTFRDMHSERDLLSKTVFPMLRSKLSSRLISINEIDMRWGITEAEAKNNQTLDLCLTQILDCDYFVGLLSERYGLVLSEYLVRNIPELNWVSNYPSGASITELEIECQIRKTKLDEKRYEKSFFYFRDKQFLNNTPDAYKIHFVDDNESSAEKLLKLKSRIRSEPFEIYDNYKCNWFKLEILNDNNSRALVTDLDEFAHRVFNNLYTSISNHHKFDDLELNECVHQTNLNNAHIRLYSSSSVARAKLGESLEKLLLDNKFIEVSKTTTDASKETANKQNSVTNITLITGQIGCGKTSFLSYFLTKYLSNKSNLLFQNFTHMVGSYENSEYIIIFLKRFCYNITYEYELENEFSLDDILNSNDYSYLKDLFAQILKSLSAKITDDRFYIIVDGVDFLHDENKNLDQSLSWLPDTIPNRIGFIFTARSTSQTKFVLGKIVQREQNKVKLNVFDIESLSILEKSDVIRHQLKVFNKSLNETPFNNQIKLLTNKKDAANPLYLKLACEELRLHNQYETLNEKLKELPIKINLMIEYTLKRLEINYGDKFINAAFMFIICSRDGLLEEELKNLLHLYFAIDKCDYFNQIENCESFINLDKKFLIENLFKKSTNSQITTLKLFSFIDSISETFLKPKSKTNGQSLLNIKSSELIETCLSLKYLNKNLTKEKKINYELINKIMALYYWFSIDENFELKWERLDQRAFIYLPYHLSYSNSYTDLALLLCDFKFLATKCSLKLSYALMDDFDLHESYKSKNILFKSTSSSSFLNKTTTLAAKLIKNALNSKRFLDYKQFILSNYHILNENPSVIYQQAMNQPNHSQTSIDLQQMLLQEDFDVAGFLFEWINKSKDTDKFSVSPIKINDINEPISSICLSPSGQKVACGTSNCEIKLYNTSTAVLIKNFQGHSGRINQLCFVGEEILCSASSDGIASIWNVNEGFRIKVLNKHNEHVVSSCCAEPNGKCLVTAGWDCSAKIWSINGELQGEFKGHPRPINSVVFSPDGFSVATACWDACIRIFNLYDRSRKAILRGHKTSISCVSFSSNGVYIASAGIDGQVKLWNSKNGSQLATLNHSKCVRSICFSPINQFLITGCSDGRAKVWSGGVGKMVRVMSEEKPQPITSCCFNQKTGETIAVGYHNGNVKLFELYGGSLKGEIKAHNSIIKRIKFSAHENYLITGSEDGTSTVIDVSEIENMKVMFELVGNTKPINGLDVNKNNKVILGSENCLLSIYQFELNEKNDGFLIDDFMSNDESKCMVKQAALITLDAHKSPITACTFNSEGDKFASASKNATIIIWSFNNINAQVIQLITINNAHSDWITDLKWSNSSDFILSSSNDFTLKLWNSNDGKEKSKMSGHTANIISCSFQYGCVVSACFDGTIKVWSHRGHEITTLKGHQKRINCCDLFVKIKNKNAVNKVENKDDENEKDLKSSDLWGDMVEEENWTSKHKKSLLNKKDFEVEHVYLVSVSDDSTIRLWKPVESDYLLSLESHNDAINSVSLSKTNLLATGAEDQSVNLWNMNEFFKNFDSGLHINADCLTKYHNTEITSICSNKIGSYILTASLDGCVMTWKSKYNNSKLIAIEHANKIQAHNRQINSIVILDEISDSKFTFATCSDDKTLKVWCLVENNQKIEIELCQTINSQNPIVFIGVVESNKKIKNNHLMSVESDTARITVKFYKISKKSIQVIQSGCNLIGGSFITNQVKLSSDILFITLMQNEIIKLDINEMFSKFQTYSVYNKEKFNQLSLSTKDWNEPVDISLQGSKMNWFSCVSKNENDTIFVGDYNGNLYDNSLNGLKLNINKKIHSARINQILSYKTSRESERLVTASQEGSVKVWSKNAEYQIGQFNSNSEITVMHKLASASDSYNNFIFGDEMGNLTLLRWYDNE